MHLKKKVQCKTFVSRETLQKLTDIEWVEGEYNQSSCLGIRIYPLELNFKWNGDMTKATREKDGGKGYQVIHMELPRINSISANLKLH